MFFIFFIVISFSNNLFANNSDAIHVWEMKEIKLHAEKTYINSYMNVTCWVELKGPNFSKRVYGFWDGENKFVMEFPVSIQSNKKFTLVIVHNGLKNYLRFVKSI